MLQSNREKWLAIVFGLCVGTFVIWESAGQLLLSPLRQTQHSIQSLTDTNRQLEQETDRINYAQRNLKQIGQQSLPSVPGKASALYQEWLIRQLSQSGISSATVTLGPAIAEAEIGHRIPMSVECMASAGRIANFLDRFHSTDLLHRLTHVNILNSSGGQRDEHRMSLSIEALALNSAVDIDSLPEPQPKPSQPSLADAFRSNNIFLKAVAVSQSAQFVNTPSPQPAYQQVVVERPPAPRAVDCVRFVASIWNGQQREAWFFDSRTKTDQAIVPNTRLTIDQQQALVLSVTEDYVTLQLDGNPLRLSLGQTVSEAQQAATL